MLTYEISNVHYGGKEVDLHVPGTSMQRFRERVDNLTFVERKPPARTSNPFTDHESPIDAGEVLERIATVKQENLKRLDDDIDILKAYLKTQHAPKAAIEALEGLTVEQHVGIIAPNWNVAPGDPQPVIRRSRDTDEHELVMMRWGIVPWFAKSEDEFKKLSTINAKSDNLTSSKMWREPFAKRRCLVPASGLYEWPKEGHAISPTYVSLNLSR